MTFAPEANYKWTNDSRIIKGSCSAVCDSLYCWPETPSGLIVKRRCSDLFKSLHSDFSGYIDGHATRECMANGMWADGRETNYSECTNSVRAHLDGIEDDGYLVPMAHYILFVGSIISLVCLAISLAIFYRFRSLQCDRVTVHVHLMISLVFRFVLILVITEPHVIGHSSSFRDVDILCESVLVLFLFSTFASVSWMLIQGLFLNLSLMVRVITISSGSQLIIYYIVGWGVPTAFIVVYVISMLLKEQERCWNGYSDMDEMWILHGPIIFELVVTGLLLINTLRVLVNKVGNSVTRRETSKIRAAAKATAILFPVLGINNIVLFYNPGGVYNKYFVTLNAVFASIQGILVSTVYCFANKDVCAALGRSRQRRNCRRTLNINEPRNELVVRISWIKFLSRSQTTSDSDSLRLGQAV